MADKIAFLARGSGSGTLASDAVITCGGRSDFADSRDDLPMSGTLELHCRSDRLEARSWGFSRHQRIRQLHKDTSSGTAPGVGERNGARPPYQ